MGEGIKIQGIPKIEGRLSASDGSHHTVKVSIIRAGKVMESFEGKTPLDFQLEDNEFQGGKSYYRLEAHGSKIGKLLSNPIFVTQLPGPS